MSILLIMILILVLTADINIDIHDNNTNNNINTAAGDQSAATSGMSSVFLLVRVAGDGRCGRGKMAQLSKHILLYEVYYITSSPMYDSMYNLYV